MSDTLPPPEHDPAATTSKAGASIDEGRGRTFPCEGCGADLVFHIGQQSLQCPYCGYVKQIEFDEDADVEEQDYRAMLARLRERRGTAGDQQPGEKEVQCDGCGGTTVFSGSLTSSECPYCGTPMQLEKVHDAEDRVPVDGVLPFQIDREQARTNLKDWVRSRWFAPNAFKRRGAEGKFNGVYLPYWTFDSMTFTRYHGERGETYTVEVGSGDDKRTETRVRWHPASGAFFRFFDDVLVLATRGMNRSLMQALEPWPLNEAAPFNQQMLAGYLARTYEVELDEGLEDARARMDEAIDAEVRDRIGGDRQRVHSVRTRCSAITFKHLLLPVWLLAYTFKGKVYNVMINAATGEVQGERPWSWVKITLAVLAAAAVAGAVVFFANQ